MYVREAASASCGKRHHSSGIGRFTESDILVQDRYFTLNAAAKPYAFAPFPTSCPLQLGRRLRFWALEGQVHLREDFPFF